MYYLLPNDEYIPPDKWEKISSYSLLARLGCPVLKSVVITNITDIDLGVVKNYLNNDYCTLRFQYIKPCSNPIRGGNLVKIEKDILTHFCGEDRILWLLEPTNRLTNLYSINMLYSAVLDEIIYEIVGYGFDISDINRGENTIHQIIRNSRYNYNYLYKEDWKGVKVNIIGQKEYQKSIQIRIEKLKKYSIDIEKVKFKESFIPIDLRMFEIINSYAFRIFSIFGYKQDMNVSSSIMEDGRVIFWDIQTPQNKKYILSGQ